MCKQSISFLSHSLYFPKFSLHYFFTFCSIFSLQLIFSHSYFSNFLFFFIPFFSVVLLVSYSSLLFSLSQSFKRYGIWGDWDTPYATLQPVYEAAQIKVFGQMVTKGHIYRGKKPVSKIDFFLQAITSLPFFYQPILCFPPSLLLSVLLLDESFLFPLSVIYLPFLSHLTLLLLLLLTLCFHLFLPYTPGPLVSLFSYSISRG